jgi:hypothetical protein
MKRAMNENKTKLEEVSKSVINNGLPKSNCHIVLFSFNSNFLHKTTKILSSDDANLVLLKFILEILNCELVLVTPNNWQENSFFKSWGDGDGHNSDVGVDRAIIHLEGEAVWAIVVQIGV